MNKQTRILEHPLPVEPGIMSDREFSILQKHRPQEERWQLIDGVPFMMTPATNRHQRMCLELAMLLNKGIGKTRPDLIALTERGLLVPGVPRFQPTADVAVVVDDDGGSYTNRFFLAAEILSPSNSEEYIEIKRNHYMQNPENFYVLVIAQDEVRVDLSARTSGWERKRLTSLRNIVVLPEFGVRFSLKSLYRGSPLST
jgi:Uma2 family endonuclease